MHLPQYILAVLTFISMIGAAPFVPNQQGKLQSQRRRWIDYPIPSAETPLPDNGLRKRSMRKRDVPYSVVPVNGVEPTTAVVTVTPSTTATTSIKTKVYTSVVTENGPAETILVTTTQAVAAPTEEPSIRTETVTASPSPISTKFYDNGLWHTYYPVKTWVTSAAAADPTPKFRLEVRSPRKAKE